MKKVYKIAGIILVFDQIIKYLIDKFIVLNTENVIIKNFFSIYYLRNTGAAFSILENNSFLLTIFSLTIMLFFYFSIRKEKNLNGILILSYGFIFGGILGNLIDRLFRGFVVDYLSFNIFGYYFPVFNLADIFIVIGIFILIINTFKTRSC